MKLVTTLLIAIALPACGSPKVLDEAGAKARVEKALRSQRYTVSVQSLIPLMSKSEVDYKTSEQSDLGSVIKTLINGRFVTQVPSVESYPVISGTFEGHDTCVSLEDMPAAPPAERLDFVLKNQKRSCGGWYQSQGVWYDSSSLTLKLGPVPNSNRLTGISNTSKADWLAKPIYEAYVTPNDFLVLSCYGGQGTNGTFSYIEREGQAYLVGRGDYLYTGVASGKRADVKTYSYAFLPELNAERGFVSVGSFQVGEISNLKLTQETRASATFAWRVVLDSLGKTLLNRAPEGVGTAEFAKKPDGTWVLDAPPRIPTNSRIF